MSEIRERLSLVVKNLSDQNYEQSLAFYRLWLAIGLTHSDITPEQILDDIFRHLSSGAVSYKDGKLVHSTAHLIIRFASDAESDSTLAPHTVELQSRLCARILRHFFRVNIAGVAWSQGTWMDSFISNVNFIASWANLGYVEGSAIRNYILQSLISENILRDHQADALITLFKIAGATFDAYADPSVVDRCFELLKDHYNRNSTKGQLVQVRLLPSNDARRSPS